MDLKFCIWGCGIRGKNLYHFMKQSHICAFIDSDPALHGTDYDGIPIISFERYRREYRDCIVIVTPFYGHFQIMDMLERENIEALSILLLPPEIFEIPVSNLFDVIDQKTGSDGKLFLYGLNLYSILLYDHYHDKRPTCIIPEKGAADWLAKRVTDCFPDCLGRLEEVGRDVLYITSNAYLGQEIPVEKRTGLYDFMYDIEAFHNPKIEAFKGIHKGRRCFIIGTGPSLRIDDLDRLRESGDICISVNGIFRAYDSTDWRPDYYLMGDRNRFQDLKDELLNKYQTKNMLIADVSLRDQSFPEFLRYHESFLHFAPHCPPLFSEDFAYGAYECGTITYDCLQFAVYLGCGEIYLYGIDFDCGEKELHFTDSYSNFSSSMSERLYEQSRAQLAYESAERKARELGIRIYNASRWSKLEVFERANFDEVLSGGRS